MAKQREVDKQFHGRAKNENYYDAREKGRAADEASYSYVPHTPTTDHFTSTCLGCCKDPDDTNPEHGGSWCTIL